MKKTRKLLALALALMMALSCMAMPAMAAGDEGIMPLGEVIQCPKCGGEADVTRTSKVYVRDVSVFYCSKNKLPHTHAEYVYTKVATCRSGSCGYSSSTPMITDECK